MHGTKMSIVRVVLANTSVEPVVFLYSVTMVFSTYLSINLLLYKACDPTGAIAQLVGSKCPDEAKAQHVVATINGWKLLVQQSVPVALVMFAGTWSDRHGRRRRPLILLPIIGQILADALSLYCTVWWSVSPAATATMQAAATACSGGTSMLSNGVNSYVADKTAEEWRTVKYGVIGGVISLGFITGMLVYGSVIVNVGFATAYQISIGLGLVCLWLTYVFVDNDEMAPSDNLPLYQDVMRTINPMEVMRNSYGVLTKQRSNNQTVILCIVVLICAPLTCIPLEGEMSVMYLFLRYKFQWNEEQFSVLNAYQMTIILIGTIFALGILSHKCQMDDALIGTIASIFDLLGAIAFFLVTQSWQLYLVPPLELFRGAALSLTSSIASKCVEPTELGAMNSLKLLMESSLKTGFLPFYNFTYNHTFEYMPGAFFLISIVLTAPLVFSFGFIYYIRRKQLQSTSTQGNSNQLTIPKTETTPVNEPSDIINHHI